MERGDTEVTHESPSITIGPEFDLSEMERQFLQAEKEMSDEDHKRNVEWVNTDNVGRIQRAGRITAREETVLRTRQQDLDIASLQHRGVSDEQE